MDFKFMIGAFGPEQWILIALLAVMVIVLIVLPMFTNKRRNKAVNELYNSIRPGDVIKTVGGIIGEVKEIKELSPVDKQMVIETGAEGSKTTMVFDIQAVYQVVNKANAPEPFKPETEPVVEEKAAEQPAPAKVEEVKAETAPAAEETAAVDAEVKSAEAEQTAEAAPQEPKASSPAKKPAAKTGTGKGKSTSSKK